MFGYIADTSNPAEAWKKVREAVTAAHSGGVITLDDAITATSAPGNSGHIEITKNLPVRGSSARRP